MSEHKDVLRDVASAFAGGRTAGPVTESDAKSVMDYMSTRDRDAAVPHEFYDAALVRMRPVTADGMDFKYMKACAEAAGSTHPFTEFDRDRLQLACEEFRDNFTKNTGMNKVQAGHALRDGWADVASIWNTGEDPGAAAAQYLFFSKAAELAGYDLAPSVSDAARLPGLLDDVGGFQPSSRHQLYLFAEGALKEREQPQRQYGRAAERLASRIGGMDASVKPDDGLSL